MHKRLQFACLVAALLLLSACGRSRAEPTPTLTLIPPPAAAQIASATATPAPSATLTAAPVSTATLAPTEAPVPTATTAPIDMAEPTEEPIAAATEPAPEEPTAAATEPAAEEPTEAPTEPAAEEPTEAPTEPAAEEPTAAATEPAPEEPTAAATEPAAEEPTAAATEPAAEEPTEAPTEPAAEEPTAAATEPAPEEPTAAATEPAAEAPTAAATESATEEPSAAATEPAPEDPTAAPTEPAPEEPTAAATEPAPEEPTAAATEKATEEPTAEATEQVAEAPTDTPVPTITAAPTATWTPIPTDSATQVPIATPTATSRPRSTIVLPEEPASNLVISSTQPLEAVVSGIDPTVAELSPDGTLITWMTPAEGPRAAQICVAGLSGNPRGCEAVPDFRGLPYRLVWSPDSAWIAFTEDSGAQALESDLWLIEVATGEVINRTDDGLEGREADVTQAHDLDYLPMWDPATGYLYFFRSGIAGDDEPSADTSQNDLRLMRLDPDSSAEPVVAQFLDTVLGEDELRFAWQRFYLQGPAAISPDGNHLAIVMAAARDMDVAEDQALWLIDLVDPSAAPRRLATALDWQTALPQWSSQPAQARGLQWSVDGQGIVVAALSNDLRLPLLLAYYVDVETAEVVPVIDFSGENDRDEFFRPNPSGAPAPRTYVPWTLALAPTANVLVLVTDMGGVVTLYGAPLPPTGSLPQPLDQVVSPGYEVVTRSSAARDGAILVYGLLLETAAAP